MAPVYGGNLENGRLHLAENIIFNNIFGIGRHIVSGKLLYQAVGHAIKIDDYNSVGITSHA